MLMRYLGGGVGHKALRSVVKIEETIALLEKRMARDLPEKSSRKSSIFHHLFARDCV